MGTVNIQAKTDPLYAAHKIVVGFRSDDIAGENETHNPNKNMTSVKTQKSYDEFYATMEQWRTRFNEILNEGGEQYKANMEALYADIYTACQNAPKAERPKYKDIMAIYRYAEEIHAQQAKVPDVVAIPVAVPDAKEFAALKEEMFAKAQGYYNDRQQKQATEFYERTTAPMVRQQAQEWAREQPPKPEQEAAPKALFRPGMSEKDQQKLQGELEKMGIAPKDIENAVATLVPEEPKKTRLISPKDQERLQGQLKEMGITPKDIENAVATLVPEEPKKTGLMSPKDEKALEELLRSKGLDPDKIQELAAKSVSGGADMGSSGVQQPSVPNTKSGGQAIG